MVLLSIMHGGEQERRSTAVLQTTCVDVTIIPYLEQRLNFNYGCYGCRDATDIGPGEAIGGFPVVELPAIVAHLEYLAKKALPHSRGKHAYDQVQETDRERNRFIILCIPLTRYPTSRDTLISSPVVHGQRNT